ncbi:MAG: hypothetical protein MN733_03195 [Nitrososphaera sp.]|nr:hypothetical protein [Nitrososphaera sp.]
MIKLIATMAVTSMLLLGCGWWGSSDIPEDAVTIKEIVEASCNFRVSLDSVVKILAASNPTVAGVDAIASAICAAVTSTPDVQALVSQCPSVNGVCIEGEFIEKEGE